MLALSIHYTSEVWQILPFFYQPNRSSGSHSFYKAVTTGCDRLMLSFHGKWL